MTRKNRVLRISEGSQSERYITLLRTFRREGLTDFEAAKLLGIDRSAVNARRAPFVKAGAVFDDGERVGPSGIRNKVWKAR